MIEGATSGVQPAVRHESIHQERRKRRPARRSAAVKVAAFAALWIAPKVARADADVVLWWLDARPWTCIGELPKLARAVELACDAAGGLCRVAHDEGSAARSAILLCGEDGTGGRLEARTREGGLLWSLELAGSDDDRYRKAGVWVARDDRDERNPGLRTTPTTTPMPDRRTTDERELPRGGLALSIQHPLFNPLDQNEIWGGRAMVAFPLDAAVRFFGAASYSSDRDQLHFGRVGGGIAWGAPWTHGFVGISVDAGAAWTRGFVWTTTPSRVGETTLDDYKPTSVQDIASYLNGNLTLQLPISFPVRPWAGMGYEISRSSVARDFINVNLGVVWNAW